MKPSKENLLSAAAELERVQGGPSDVSLWLRKSAEAKTGGSEQRGTSQRVLDRLHKIHALWTEGKTVFEIAAALEMSVNSLTQDVVRARREFNLCPTRIGRILARPPVGTKHPVVTLPIGLRVFASYRKVFFKAVITDGGICVQNAGTFRSLSEGAMIALQNRFGDKPPINGWDFWRVRLKTGQDCHLTNLRCSPELMEQIQQIEPLQTETLIEIDQHGAVTWAEFTAAQASRLTSDAVEQLQIELEAYGKAAFRIGNEKYAVRRVTMTVHSPE